MGARNGRVFRVRDHLHRLSSSARQLGLTERLRVGPLEEAVQLVVERNELESARVRLTLTGGNLNALQQQAESVLDPTIVIVAQPPTAYPESFFERGTAVMVADGRLNPLDPMGGHKTLNYWPRIRALQHAAGHGTAEALWFDVSNHLACGSVSNVFLVEDDVLYTPIARGEEEQGALPSTVLPGITRRTIIELAEQMGIGLSTRMLTYDDVSSADELFLTNSSWGVLPVVAVERTEIGTGEVGPMTHRLRQAWIDAVEFDTRDQ